MARKRQPGTDEQQPARKRTPTLLLELPLQVTSAQAKRLRAHLEAARQLDNAILSGAIRFPERKQEGRGENLNFVFEVGCNSQPSVNERNASSPRKRLVLNAVKREENRVPFDSNGGIPDSLHLWVGDEHTFELS